MEQKRLIEPSWHDSYMLNQAYHLNLRLFFQNHTTDSSFDYELPNFRGLQSLNFPQCIFVTNKERQTPFILWLKNTYFSRDRSGAI